MGLSRRAFVIGLVAQVALAAGLSLGAYAGALPHWRWLNRYDYVLHALIVGPLAMWLDGTLDFRCLWPRARVCIPLGPAIISALAVAEEYLQRLSPHRSSTWKDLIGNLAGIALFTLLGRSLLRSRGAR